MSSLFKLVIIILVTFVVSGCGDYSIKLPNGFNLDRLNASEIVISDEENRVVIYPNIIGYAVRGKYVYGARSIENQRSGDAIKNYFILNTENGSIESDLAKDEFIIRVNETNTGDPVELKKPSRFH